MNSPEVERNQRIKELFLAASDLSAVSRDSFLRQACGPDHRMWGDVRELLSIHERQDLALDETPLSTLGFPSRPFPLRHQPRHKTGDLLAGRYRVTRFIAAGGMGEVYAVSDEAKHRGRELALKFIRAPLSPTDEEQIQARFQREVRLARRIVHPNVCRVYSLERHGDEMFCVMDLLEGQTLSARLHKGPPLTPDEALPLIEDICAGLQAAHEAGVLHRDLKPANIFLAQTPGERAKAVIIDFGLASARTPGQTLTADGVLIGTLAYMAPEQLEEGRASVPADLYSLGAVMFEMMMGKKHLDAPSPLRLAMLKARSSRHAPHFGDRKVPGVWREAILRCLRADPRRRFRSAAELGAFLKRGRVSTSYVLSRTPVLALMLALAIALLSWRVVAYTRADYEPPAAAQAEFDRAMAAFADARAQAAAQHLEKSIKLAPRFVLARSWLAEAYFHLDQADQARNALLAASAELESRRFPGYRERLALQAVRSELMRDYAAAGEGFAQLAAELPGLHRAAAELASARAWELRGNLKNAAGVLHSLTGREPGSGAAHLHYAAVLAKLHDERAAAEFGRAGQHLAPSNRQGQAALLLSRVAEGYPGSGGAHADLDRAEALSAATGDAFLQLQARYRRAVLLAAESRLGAAVPILQATATEAERQGRLDLAARALGEAGYTQYRQQLMPEAETTLQRAVSLAERAKSDLTLAVNRVRLGEFRAGQRRFLEAWQLIEPSVAWLRENRHERELMLSLTKQVSVCINLPQCEDRVEPSAAEALTLARRWKDPLLEMTALQRLAGIYRMKDPRRSIAVSEEVISLARRQSIWMPVAQAAAPYAYTGQFARAEALLSEAERGLGAQPPSAKREAQLSVVRRERALLRFYQEQSCPAWPLPGEPVVEDFRVAACAAPRPQLETLLIRALEHAREMERRGDLWQATSLLTLAAQMKLTLGGRDAEAAAHAREALRLRTGSSLHQLLEFEAQLTLRAALGRMAPGSPAFQSADARVRELAPALGLSLERFNGRADLARLWNLR